MTKAYDYTADEKLAALPLALRERMTSIQQARIDAGLTDDSGLVRRTAEARDRANAALARRRTADATCGGGM